VPQAMQRRHGQVRNDYSANTRWVPSPVGIGGQGVVQAVEALGPHPVIGRHPRQHFGQRIDPEPVAAGDRGLSKRKTTTIVVIACARTQE
jgi:hypothetical protein